MSGKLVKEEPVDVKRLNLAIPSGLYADIETYANQHQITVIEIIRRFLKMGMFVEENTVYKKTENGSYQALLFV